MARSIKVESNPSAARVEIYDDGELIDEITTPGRFYLFQDRNLTMIISKPGYRTTTQTIRFRYSGVRATVSAVSGVFCLMMPTAVDFFSGAMKVPEKQVYTIALEPLEEGEREIEFDVLIHQDGSLVVQSTAHHSP